MIQAADIRDALSVESVLDRYGLKRRRQGSEYRLGLCPSCGDKSSRLAIAISARTGRWHHHGPGCSGDLFDVIAASEGLDARRDFRRVVELAADIAGMSDLSDAEREIRTREAKARAAAEIEADLERRIAARSTAGAAWESYARFDPRGVAYLEERGLDASRLINADLVRFASEGVAVALHGAEGAVISTARRLYEPHDGIRMLTLKDCSSKGYMIGWSGQIRSECDVVVTEGIADSLTAALAYPGAVVLGASGASLLPRLVASIVLRVRLARARLILIPHSDEVGIARMAAAARIAIAAGLELDDRLVVVDLPEKDLNDAWRAGWRP